MRVPVIPSSMTVAMLAAGSAGVFICLLLGMSGAAAAWLAASIVFALLAATAWDYTASVRAWRRSAPTLARRLPQAFALGARRPVPLFIENHGSRAWDCQLHDQPDGSLLFEGLPIRVTLPPGKGVEASYTVRPSTRGEVTFDSADVRVRSRWGLCELRERLGVREVRRVYPEFGQIGRYAWLAGDRRLQEIGIKTYQLRGEGTDFKQLAEYRAGDPVRHIDWPATLRLGKPMLREFQDERDQCVMLLVDCGRRMRADNRSGAIGSAHFDQVLNAVMLLAYVALKQGDAVGAMTFGTPPGAARSIPPRKGLHALNLLMAQLYAVQPTLTHSDYLAAAQDLLRRQRKRALIVIITNFRDEDSSELRLALRLLRSRHLVMLASLRERVVAELASQPLSSGEAVLEVASAHMYEQACRDAFNRLAARDALMVNAEPERLGIELVNRYHAMKRAGTI